MKKQEDINEYRFKFESYLDEKNASALSFIEKEIIPEIDNVFKKIDNHVDQLLDEIIGVQNSTKEKILEKKFKKREMEHLMKFRAMSRVQQEQSLEQ